MGHILLTGPPGIGKTTVLVRLISMLGDVAAGFYTRELRQGGVRTGFAILNTYGERGILARVGFPGPYRVGKYGVDVEALERVGVASLLRAQRDLAVRFIILDEIGGMELCSDLFQETVRRIVQSDKTMIATVHRRPHSFSDSLKAREDVELYTVTLRNRDSLPAAICARLRGAGDWERRPE